MCEELGRYCVAYVDKYDQWYRVELLNWLLVSICSLSFKFKISFPLLFFLLQESDTNLVKVQLFDYGVCVYVPFYKLHPMLEEVSHYPKLAQRCHLHTVSFMHILYFSIINVKSRHCNTCCVNMLTFSINCLNTCIHINLY